MYVKKGYYDSCFILDYYFLIIFKILVNYVGKKGIIFQILFGFLIKLKYRLVKFIFLKINL